MTTLVFVLVVSGPLQGHKYFVISDTPILIGRSNEAIIRINYDDFCSRKHALLYWENKAFFIKDLDSTNGTFVNNDRISQKTELHDGDIIGLGETKLAISVKDINKGDEASTEDGIPYED